MNRPLHIIVLLAAALSSYAAAPSARPNILIVMCDDLGYADVGFNGAKDIRTPALDKLAAAGTVCTSAYVAHPFCGPSRMGLLSGRYPHEFGGQFNHPPFQEGLTEYDSLGIPEEETLISTVLQDAGYFTGAIGKWHLGIDKPFHPNTRGFDDFYGFLGGGHMYFPEKYAGIYERQNKAGVERINEYVLPLEHNGEQVTPKGYLTDELTGEAIRFIDTAAQKKKQPFFLYLAYNAPHSPMEASDEDLAVFSDIANPKRRTYAAMVYAVDRGVARIVDSLKKNGQYDNTLIIFLSDNGGKPSQGASNAPLRGQKGDTFEGGFRVPMFFHWPDNVPVQTFNHPVSALDFYPTFVQLAGTKLPKGKELDGKDIMADLKKGTSPRKGEMIYSMRHRNSYSDVSARRDDWKVTRYGGQPWRLFNIDEDPGENNDLATQHPERVQEMVKKAEGWSGTHVQPLWFHAGQARDEWKKNNMPRFDKTFSPDIGAPSLAPVKYITEQSAAPKAAMPSAPAGVKLKKGDSTKEMFVAQEKAKWDKNGWNWDLSKVETLFSTIDANGDGIASGQEKKAYWAK
ncbi:sulfatase-like hydrolase/transferase [Pontiella sulfatireligans]|uniref:Arylsulfatase n=1 Tax=Pontiella sulfatireligans TaxID=2750658 RepID=A0A6C2ULY0_9BACT|nr:sulfatase-like hydrolase/transferase [Pontiella sulfatireligans]SPS74414.1 sulfatase S1_19 [Kiritimatiellales bacterium]VGO20437.1 Arylsulfatase [Pontiella sulfatireligans]